jgi:hypothetical protein
VIAGEAHAIREFAVRLVSAFASFVVGAVAIAAVAHPAEEGAFAGPPPPVPEIAFTTVALSLAAVIGLIGAVRDSRPLIGAAGGLILPWGLMGSLLVVPAALLLGACGLVPRNHSPRQNEILAGLLIVTLGYATFIVPALTRTARCWVAIDGPAGVEYRSADGLPDELTAGQVGAGCDGGVPSTAAFPVSLLLAGSAVAIAVRSSART